MTEHVRPTKRCLDDLHLPFPPLTHPLHKVDHALVAKAQRVPGEVEAGGAERIRVLRDYVWFKVKIGDDRGLAGRVPVPPEVGDARGEQWWLAAAGKRRQDSPAHDFYSRLAQDLKARAKLGPHALAEVGSTALFPVEIDYRRLLAERTALITEAIRRTVRRLIAESARTGLKTHVHTNGHRLTCLVKALDGETYLAVCAEGFVDPRLIAVILDAVPGVDVESWGAEPGRVFGLTPGEGQIVYSTMIPTASLSQLLDEFHPDAP